MNPQAIIPTIDPIPLPSPVWLLKTLLLLTFLLHLIAMNLLVSGAFQAAIARMKSNNSAQGGFFRRLFADNIKELPTLVAATVTLGVAPLLFVQVLFGHLTYTASIAMGWFWWLVFPLIIVAYYIFYYLKFRSPDPKTGTPSGSVVLIWISTVLLFWVSFIFSNKFNLAAQPERFTPLILESAKGWSLNITDPTTFPRWLHIILGAIAVGGLWTMWKGRRNYNSDKSYGTFQLRLGYKLFAYPTMVNILVGFIFMVTLPRDIMLRMMGQGFLETALWLIGLGVAIWAIPLLKRAIDAPFSVALPLGTVMLTICLVTMVLLRDLIRSAYQGKYFTLSMPQVDVYWGPILMFLIAFISGIAVFWWLVKSYLKQK